MDDMNRFIADDLRNCFFDGIEATRFDSGNIHSSIKRPCSPIVYLPHIEAFQAKGEKFHFVYLGAKGDWPWLRKLMNLKSGFRSLRVCHLCDKDVP